MLDAVGRGVTVSNPAREHTGSLPWSSLSTLTQTGPVSASEPMVTLVDSCDVVRAVTLTVVNAMSDAVPTVVVFPAALQTTVEPVPTCDGGIRCSDTRACGLNPPPVTVSVREVAPCPIDASEIAVMIGDPLIVSALAAETRPPSPFTTDRLRTVAAAPVVTQTLRTSAVADTDVTVVVTSLLELENVACTVPVRAFALKPVPGTVTATPGAEASHWRVAGFVPAPRPRLFGVIPTTVTVGGAAICSWVSAATSPLSSRLSR